MASKHMHTRVCVCLYVVYAYVHLFEVAVSFCYYSDCICMWVCMDNE